MHFNLKKAAGLAVVPLLGGALAVSAAASPASVTAVPRTPKELSSITLNLPFLMCRSG